MNSWIAFFVGLALGIAICAVLEKHGDWRE